jgi:hypothetical protein
MRQRDVANLCAVVATAMVHCATSLEASLNLGLMESMR